MKSTLYLKTFNECSFTATAPPGSDELHNSERTTKGAGVGTSRAQTMTDECSNTATVPTDSDELHDDERTTKGAGAGTSRAQTTTVAAMTEITDTPSRKTKRGRGKRGSQAGNGTRNREKGRTAGAEDRKADN